eukprot:jgi/Mesen1/7914/ME000422S07076
MGEWSNALPYSPDTDGDYVKLGLAQEQGYAKSSAGSFFWSYKKLAAWYDPWDFRVCIAKGWLK